MHYAKRPTTDKLETQWIARYYSKMHQDSEEFTCYINIS